MTQQLLQDYLKNETDTYETQIADNQHKTVTAKSIVFEKKRYESPHPNTLVFKLLSVPMNIVLEEEYYSVGGGFIQRKGEDLQAPKMIKCQCMLLRQ